MSNRHLSTGALTPAQKQQQDARYAKGYAYDVLIIGSGMSALVAASLLAKSGRTVCILEAHDVPGGYAHTFEMQGFHFCAQVHYIWGCAPGQSIHQFVERLGLREKVEFFAFDPKGYDRAGLPDGKLIGVPYGFDNLINQIDAAYPGEREALTRFVGVLRALRDEMRLLPEKIRWWHYLQAPLHFRTLLRYRNSTLQQLFDECRLGKEAQAILCCQAGDLGSPPEELSLLAYTGLFSGYNEGAYFPKGHFKGYIQSLVDFITSHPGCHIFYETEVTEIQTDGDRVVACRCADGKTFSAQTYLCNMDPQRAAHLIGWQDVPQGRKEPLSYDYSPSSLICYVGVEGVDLRDYGLTNANIWHLGQWNMNTMWKQQMAGNFDNPWIFLSSPSLRTPEQIDAPTGCQTLELGTLAPYADWAELSAKDPGGYTARKNKISMHMLDILEARYLPGIRKHIKMMVTGTPATSEYYCRAPKGNSYGSTLTPLNMSLGRLKPDSPWSNLLWCNASSGYAGINGTTLTGANVYTHLTGDVVFRSDAYPSEAEAIAFAKTRSEF